MLRLFAELDEHYGRLDALINNAGVLEAQMRLERMDVARWQRVLATNVIGSFLCCREAIKRMSSQHGGNGGAIVNVSSMAARLGSPNEYINYAAAKGAVDNLTIGLAREVAGEGIRVNAVRPGLSRPISTPPAANRGVSRGSRAAYRCSAAAGPKKRRRRFSG